MTAARTHHGRPRVHTTPRSLPALPAELSGRHDLGEGPTEQALDDGVADWMGRGAWVVSGVLAAALVFALVFWQPERYAHPQAEGASAAGNEGHGPTGLSPTVVHLAEARVATGVPLSRAGEALAAGTPVHEGDELHAPPGGCVRVEPAMRVCASEPSDLSVRSLAGRHRVLELHGGEVWTETRAGDDARLVLRRQGLRATAEQASFSFGADAKGAEVRVARGQVTVTRHLDREVVTAGHGAHYDEATGLTTFDLDEAGRLRLARARRLAKRGTAVRSAAPSAGPPTPTPAPAEGAPSEPVATGAMGEPGASAPAEVPAQADAGAAPPAQASSSVDLPATPAESEAELALAHAEALREAQRFAEADAAFERLVAQHPDSASAKRAAVELGDLRLNQRGDALGALGAYRMFEAALPPGPLDSRARLGVIAALRRLNRFAHERKAIEDFVARYPGSTEVPKLEARRTFLGGS